MIYIVDDDQAIRHSLGLLLSSEGLDSQGFASAGEFLAACDPSDSDCLIVDVDLPGMDGVELLKRVRARGLTLPAYVVTGRPSALTRRRAQEAGATSFLEKPVNADVLIALIRDGKAGPS
jgi:two-component system response regulator FixJ